MFLKSRNVAGHASFLRYFAAFSKGARKHVNLMLDDEFVHGAGLHALGVNHVDVVGQHVAHGQQRGQQPATPTH